LCVDGKKSNSTMSHNGTPKYHLEPKEAGMHERHAPKMSSVHLQIRVN
jgi:hypothetical protein